MPRTWWVCAAVGAGISSLRTKSAGGSNDTYANGACRERRRARALWSLGVDGRRSRGGRTRGPAGTDSNAKLLVPAVPMLRGWATRQFAGELTVRYVIVPLALDSVLVGAAWS